MIKRYLAILAVISLFAGAAAQEQPSGEGQGRGGRGRGGGSSGFEQMRERMRQANEQIKEKFPEEYKELEQLESTDRRAASQKRLELARKAGIEMPDFGRGRGGERRPEPQDAQKNQLEEWQKAEEAIKAKFPDEYAAMEKLRETDAAAALVKLRELAEKAEVKLPEGDPPGKAVGPRNVSRLAVERANQILQRRYPEEYAEIVKLREEDPDLAREKYRELFQRAGLTAEELKKQVVARAASTRVIQVEVPQNNTNNNNNNNRRTWGGGGMQGGPWGGGR